MVSQTICRQLTQYICLMMEEEAEEGSDGVGVPVKIHLLSPSSAVLIRSAFVESDFPMWCPSSTMILPNINSIKSEVRDSCPSNPTSASTL